MHSSVLVLVLVFMAGTSTSLHCKLKSSRTLYIKNNDSTRAHDDACHCIHSRQVSALKDSEHKLHSAMEQLARDMALLSQDVLALTDGAQVRRERAWGWRD